MPGRLDIKNNSNSKKVSISVASIDGKITHVKHKWLQEGESVNIIVKGGIKKLSVFNTDGLLSWDGYIPSYGDSAIQLFPEKDLVKYKDNALVNTLKSPKNIKSSPILSNRVQIGIFLILAILILFFIVYYTRKN